MMQPLTKKIWTILLLTITCSIAAYSNTNNDNKAQLPIINKFKKWMAQHPDERLYMSTDKSLYKPGETVWFTTFVRNAATLTTDSISSILHVEIINPKGTVENHLKYMIADGVVNGNFMFTPGMAGGIYKFKAYTMWQLNDTTQKIFEKEITLQNAILPSLIMKLDYKEKGYSPGQTATADLELKSLDDLAIRQHEFEYTILLQGEKKLEQKGITDDKGKAVINYTLPVDLKSADGLLSVKLTYKGVTESISRSIPINLKNVMVEFYPEGGDLVAGISSNVTFAAVDEYGKPVNVEGNIYSADGTMLTAFNSYHHGMGKFRLTAQQGAGYYALVKGYGDKKFMLPTVNDNGVSIEAGNIANGSLPITLNAKHETSYVVTAQMRGNLLYAQKVEMLEHTGKAFISTTDMGTGVLQVTVLNLSGQPVAERLVFINKEQQLNLQLTTDKSKYAPHEKVSLKVKATDNNGKPVSGDITVSVVDDKVISLANDKQGNILAKLLLEADITGDVLEPNFYFDKNEAKAEEALNLLMMTRGWRRIVWHTIQGPDTIKYTKPEEKIVAGIVRNFRDGKPTRGAYVQVYGGGPSAITNRRGEFEIIGLDLDNIQTLMVKRPFKELYYTINEYGTKHDLDFNAASARAYSSSYPNSYQPPVNRNTTAPVNYAENVRTAKRAPVIRYAPGTGRVYGEVVNYSGEPIVSGTVVLQGSTTVGAVTDLDGKYEFRGAPQGKQKIKFAYIGCLSQIIEVDIHPTQDVYVKVFLDENEVLLETVVVASAKYETRMAEAPVSMSVVRNSSISSGPVIPPSSIVQRNIGINPETSSNLGGKTSSYNKTTSEHAVSMDVITARQLTTQNITNIVTLEEAMNRVPGVAMQPGLVTYYIDGVKIVGDPAMALDLMMEMRVYNGGVPARYNGATGSVIDITTMRAPDLLYYTYRGTEVRVLNENIGRRYSYGRQFPQIIHAPVGTPGAFFDNRQTIYWSGAIRLDAKGMANVEFYNGDVATTFRITAEGIADNGLVGRSEKTYSVQAPLGIDGKAPNQVATGDIIDFNLVVSNGTDTNMMVDLNYELPYSWAIINNMPSQVEVAANSFKVMELKIQAGKQDGNYRVMVQATSGNHKDILYKNIVVKGVAYPVALSHSGNCTSQSFTINVGDVVDSSMSSSFIVYPSPTSDLINAVQGILRMPHGCFEQVSSSTYPNILALQLLRQTGWSNESVERQAKEYIASGHAQLAKYEVADGGFDLWGKGEPNIPMTAYGIMEFAEMQKVYDGVDTAMVGRALRMLLGRLRGNEFAVGSKNSYFYGADNSVTANAYIAFALTQAGVTTGLNDVADKLVRQLNTSKESYQLALLSTTLYNLGRHVQHYEINSKLAAMQKPDGSWPTTTPSITGSTGQSLAIEATALAMIALSKQEGMYEGQLQKGMQFILSNRYYGRFGSTQSTILALKAMLTVMRQQVDANWSSSISINVNGLEVNHGNVTARGGEYRFDEMYKYLKPGSNTIDVLFTQPNAGVGYSMDANWQSNLPANNQLCKVEISTALSSSTAQVGDPIRLNVNFKNKEHVPVPNPIAIVEIPGGLSLQAWQLKELTEKNIIDYYELYGNSIVLYFSELKANETRLIPLDLKTEAKGEFKAAASVGYLYYTDEHKHWSEGQKVKVK